MVVSYKTRKTSEAWCVYSIRTHPSQPRFTDGVPCSWDDTMTDLMCHPQDYLQWVENLASSLRGASTTAPAGTAQPLPHIPACPAIPFASGACHCNGAGHSGMMDLAANLVRSLFMQHDLAGMLAGDVDADVLASPRPQRSRILHWLPSPSRCESRNHTWFSFSVFSTRMKISRPFRL